MPRLSAILRCYLRTEEWVKIGKLHYKSGDTNVAIFRAIICQLKLSIASLASFLKFIFKWLPILTSFSLESSRSGI